LHLSIPKIRASTLSNHLHPPLGGDEHLRTVSLHLKREISHPIPLQWVASIRDFPNRRFQLVLFLKKSVEKITIPEKETGIHTLIAAKRSSHPINVPFGENWR
jgi:hypothetical protein